MILRYLYAALLTSYLASGVRAGELDDFYRSDQVQSIDLRVAEEDMERMLAALPKRVYVPATFRWRDISMKKVAVRFKGNSSSNPKQTHKRSFLIKFDKYEDGGRFLGLRRAAFDNGVQFGSLFSEPIITEILRDLDIKTHRCNYATICLNGKYLGVYVNVERIDESFIEHHLPDQNGSLFKVDEGGPGCNLQFLGDDPAAYGRTFEPKSKSAEKNVAQLVEFIKMINQPMSDATTSLESKMEINDFLEVTAVMLLSGAFDQLTGWNPHNYYLYHNRKNDRWRYLPWDLDVGFSDQAFGRIPVLADWNAAWPVPASGPPNPLLERIIADRALLARYRRAARVILDKYFEPERLCKVIDANYELIKKDLRSDPFPHRRVTAPSDRSYDDVVESMKEFVRNRYASADHQLETPGPRPKSVRRSPTQGTNRRQRIPPKLAIKIQRIERRAEEMRKNGEELLPIQTLMQKVGPLLQQGKVKEAELLIDAAMKLTGEKPETADETRSKTCGFTGLTHRLHVLLPLTKQSAKSLGVDCAIL